MDGTRRILCVGAITRDTIFRIATLPPGPGKFLPTDAVEVAGGMAASAAASAARLGGTVSLWASVGEDATGEGLIAEIGSEGVDCALVRRVAGARTAFAAILVDGTGERIIVPQYDRQLLSTPALPVSLGERAYAVVMSDVRWPEAGALALAAAREAGLPAVLDADVAPRETLERLLPLATHVVASLPAAQMLTGATDGREVAERLAGTHPGFVAVTAGAEGCYWLDAETGTTRHTPSPHVEAIDTLAAGDVFHGAFAVGLAEGWPIATIIRFAAVAAAIKCTRFGGRAGAPTRAETEAMLASLPETH